MSQLNPVVDHLQPSLEYGTIVTEGDDKTFEVELSYGVVSAKKAVGCLLQPKKDDLVLVSVDIHGACYVLHVLERNDEDSCVNEINFPGDCVMHCQGSLDLRANQNVSLAAFDSVEISGDVIGVHGHKAEVNINKISVLGQMLHTQVKRITTVAKSIEQSMKRLSQRMENSERFVEDHEEIQTGSTRHLVEDTLTTHAGNTLNVSKELHTMHAEQIHMS